MSKQPSTVQTTQNSTQTVPAYASEAQQNLLNSGYGMLGNYLGLQPNQRVAGVNADQSQAYDLARQVAQGAFQTQAPSLTPATSGYTPTGYAMTPTQASGYSATRRGLSGCEPAVLQRSIQISAVGRLRSCGEWARRFTGRGIDRARSGRQPRSAL